MLYGTAFNRSRASRGTPRAPVPNRKQSGSREAPGSHRTAIEVEAGQALVSVGKACQSNVGFKRDVKERPHAGTHHLRIEGVDTARAQQTPETAEPREGTQYRTQVAGVLNLMQINRFFAGHRFSRARRHGHHRQNPLGCPGVSELCHLAIAEGMSPERAVPVLIGTGDVKLRGFQSRLAGGSFLQFKNQVLALNEVVAKRLPVLFLVQPFDVGQIHEGGLPSGRLGGF